MQIAGKHYQSISYDGAADVIVIIDQTRLPHKFECSSLNSLSETCTAIASMQVRGAPLIGVTAAYGVYFGLREDPTALDEVLDRLEATRPTAVNLAWALRRCRQSLQAVAVEEVAAQALQLAQKLEKEDIAVCAGIGEQGADVLERLWQDRKGSQDCLNILTHCNAGALATVDWGTALAVVYKTVERGIPVHVWVDETRPRNQGAALTCWELGQQGIPHTLIVDNAGGHLMQRGQIDIVVVGADRVTASGDVCNKIGTYLKALAAKDCAVPFYVALPVSSFDFSLDNGLLEIPIEERDGSEVLTIDGANAEGRVENIAIAPAGTHASNFAFDVTPARLVTALITEQGVFAATRQSLQVLAADAKPGKNPSTHG